MGLEGALAAIKGLKYEIQGYKLKGMNVGRAVELLEALESIAVKAANEKDTKTVYEVEALVIKVYESVINIVKEHYLYELVRLTIAFCDVHKDVCSEYKLDKLVHEYVSSMLQLDLP